METSKLIGMTDFVLEQENILRNDSDYTNAEAILKCINYANFLKQPLELWMLVPCDENGNVLEEPPINVDENNVDWQIKYQQAKERCLFDGFELIKESSNDKVKMVWNKNKTTIGFGFSKNMHGTIEQYVSYKLTLTQTAINQITK